MVAKVQTPRQDASLSAVVGGVTEAMHAAHRAAKAVTQIPLVEEIEVGNVIALRVEASFARGAPRDEAYVSAVLRQLVKSGELRRAGISYTAKVLDTPMINAFSLPGGHLYITTGLLDLIETEAELASAMGHEMAHVDLKHCIERIQYTTAAQKIGGKSIANLVQVGTALWSQTFSRELELEADRQGMLYAYRAGYEPRAGAALFLRMKRLHSGAEEMPSSIPEQTRYIVKSALDEYLISHPPEEARIRAFEIAYREHRVDLNRRSYVGRSNWRDRVSRAEREGGDEWMAK